MKLRKYSRDYPKDLFEIVWRVAEPSRQQKLLMLQNQAQLLDL